MLTMQQRQQRQQQTELKAKLEKYNTIQSPTILDIDAYYRCILEAEKCFSQLTDLNLTEKREVAAFFKKHYRTLTEWVSHVNMDEQHRNLIELFRLDDAKLLKRFKSTSPIFVNNLTFENVHDIEIAAFYMRMIYIFNIRIPTIIQGLPFAEDNVIKGYLPSLYTLLEFYTARNQNSSHALNVMLHELILKSDQAIKNQLDLFEEIASDIQSQLKKVKEQSAELAEQYLQYVVKKKPVPEGQTVPTARELFAQIERIEDISPELLDSRKQIIGIQQYLTKYRKTLHSALNDYANQASEPNNHQAAKGSGASNKNNQPSPLAKLKSLINNEEAHRALEQRNDEISKSTILTENDITSCCHVARQALLDALYSFSIVDKAATKLQSAIEFAEQLKNDKREDVPSGFKPMTYHKLQNLNEQSVSIFKQCANASSEVKAWLDKYSKLEDKTFCAEFYAKFQQAQMLYEDINSFVKRNSRDYQYITLQADAASRKIKSYETMLAQSQVVDIEILDLHIVLNELVMKGGWPKSESALIEFKDKTDRFIKEFNAKWVELSTQINKAVNEFDFTKYGLVHDLGQDKRLQELHVLLTTQQIRLSGKTRECLFNIQCMYNNMVAAIAFHLCLEKFKDLQLTEELAGRKDLPHLLRSLQDEKMQTIAGHLQQFLTRLSVTEVTSIEDLTQCIAGIVDADVDAIADNNEMGDADNQVTPEPLAVTETIKSCKDTERSKLRKQLGLSEDFRAILKGLLDADDYNLFDNIPFDTINMNPKLIAQNLFESIGKIFAEKQKQAKPNYELIIVDRKSASPSSEQLAQNGELGVKTDAVGGTENSDNRIRSAAEVHRLQHDASLATANADGAEQIALGQQRLANVIAEFKLNRHQTRSNQDSAAAVVQRSISANTPAATTANTLAVTVDKSAGKRSNPQQQTDDEYVPKKKRSSKRAAKGVEANKDKDQADDDVIMHAVNAASASGSSVLSNQLPDNNIIVDLFPVDQSFNYDSAPKLTYKQIREQGGMKWKREHSSVVHKMHFTEEGNECKILGRANGMIAENLIDSYYTPDDSILEASRNLHLQRVSEGWTNFELESDNPIMLARAHAFLTVLSCQLNVRLSITTKCSAPDVEELAWQQYVESELGEWNEMLGSDKYHARLQQCIECVWHNRNVKIDLANYKTQALAQVNFQEFQLRQTQSTGQALWSTNSSTLYRPGKPASFTSTFDPMAARIQTQAAAQHGMPVGNHEQRRPETMVH